MSPVIDRPTGTQAWLRCVRSWLVNRTGTLVSNAPARAWDHWSCFFAAL